MTGSGSLGAGGSPPTPYFSPRRHSYQVETSPPLDAGQPHIGRRGPSRGGTLTTPYSNTPLNLPRSTAKMVLSLTFFVGQVIAMRLISIAFFFGTVVAVPDLVIQVRGSSLGAEFAELLERLRKESAGEYDKVVELAKTDRVAALRFLRERYGPKGEKADPEKKPDTGAAKLERGKINPADAPRPARRERFTLLER